MTKFFVPQAAERVASTCVELFRGYGFVKNDPVEKLYRDAEIGRIYKGTSNMEGTSNMQLVTIVTGTLVVV